MYAHTYTHTWVSYDDGEGEWLDLGHEHLRTYSDVIAAERHSRALDALRRQLSVESLELAERIEIKSCLAGIERHVLSGKYDTAGGGSSDAGFVADVMAALCQSNGSSNKVRSPMKESDQRKGKHVDNSAMQFGKSSDDEMALKEAQTKAADTNNAMQSMLQMLKTISAGWDSDRTDLKPEDTTQQSVASQGAAAAAVDEEDGGGMFSDEIECVFSLESLLAAMPLDVESRDFGLVPGIAFSRELIARKGCEPQVHDTFNLRDKGHSRAEVEKLLEAGFAKDGLLWLGHVVSGRWQCRRPMALQALKHVLEGLVRSGHVIRLSAGSLKHGSVAQMMGREADDSEDDDEDCDEILKVRVRASDEEASCDGQAFVVANHFSPANRGTASAKCAREDGQAGHAFVDGNAAAAEQEMTQPESELSEYELTRQRQIERNHVFLASLALKKLV